MLEKKHQPVISTRRFAKRLAFFIGLAFLIILFALALGIAGYHWVAGFDWVDSLLNASMILTGMGPVGELRSTAAKLFASAYALFSGIVFLTLMGVILTPILHRVMHKFHVEADTPEKKK